MNLLRQLARWTPGRQGSGYEKMLLFASPFPLPFDVYLLRFREGAYVDWHRDPAPPGKQHWRLNVFLRKALEGGQFLRRGSMPDPWAWYQLFRPDIQEHSVTPVVRGTRYVLSIGWLWRR